MEGFFFGAQQELFGAHHSAVGAERGIVLICSPLSPEWLVIHRVLRTLADRMAEKGFSVMRFDYFGCGDSAGEHEQASLARWIDDIDTAVIELRRRSSPVPLYVIGVRLGALLAARAGARRDDVDALVLWDPPLNGAAHGNALRANMRRMLSTAHVIADEATRRDLPSEILGYPVNSQFWHELDQLDFDLQHPPARRALLVESDPRSFGAVAARLSPLSLPIEQLPLEEPELWEWVEDVTRLQLPHRISAAITDWIAKSQP
jgi:uncharacterized protein